jgi:hypothetical protein
MEINGQLHASAALSPVPSGPQSRSGGCGKKKQSLPYRESNSDRPTTTPAFWMTKYTAMKKYYVIN